MTTSTTAKTIDATLRALAGAWIGGGRMFYNMQLAGTLTDDVFFAGDSTLDATFMQFAELLGMDRGELHDLFDECLATAKLSAPPSLADARTLGQALVERILPIIVVRRARAMVKGNEGAGHRLA